MASKFLQRLTLAAVLLGALSVMDAQATAAARPVRRTNRPEAARGFNLFAGAVNVMLNVNRVQCNINNIGEQCVDPTNSSVVGGGFWPKGTPDQYIFNGGLELAGIIGNGYNKTVFAWAGDTVGTFFFDPRGDQTVGQGLTNVYNSLNAADVAAWPSAAYVKDPTLYNVSLLNRQTISQQDTWVRYWDGNVNLLTGRQHPMGLLVDQRSMMWNFPSGNQDIVYFVERFINISAGPASYYANLSQYGYSASDIADIVTIAQNYRAAVASKFNVTIPDSGYSFTQVYGGPEEDPDEGNSGVNYSSANLPFSMDFVYKANELEPNWSYPPDIFGAAPFTAAPGMQGNKFLKGPADGAGNQIGITMFTNTTNGAPFPDRFGVQQLWRLASNHLNAQDGACNAPTNTPLCQLVQTAADTRMFMFSGPLTIKPGESQVVVLSYIMAAPVAAAIANDGAGHVLGSGSFDLKPGVPGTPTGFISASSRAGQTSVDTIRQIEKAIGWATAGNSAVALDVNANGKLDQGEIPVVPRSLMGKALVAQAVYDNKFLLPFAPESPNFYLIPGDNQVTVVWEPSLTESVGHGDPYFLVASNPLTSLYDPNFRAYDVEGYRIWRGRAESSMEVIAAFDYAGTTITDYTGQFWTQNDYGTRCAPELGILATCPVAFTYPYVGVGPSHKVSLVGNVIQVPPGGRVQLSSGDVLMVTPDTAVTGGNSGLPALRDSGVPFTYIDNTAKNGFRYFYAVTAFDINSVKSGPSSLESPLTTKQSTPRVASGQEVAGTASAPVLVGGGNVTLDPTAPLPTINATTGIFSGPMPPTNATNLGFTAFLPQVLADGAVTVSIDSIIPGAWLTGDYITDAIPATYWMTGQGAGAPIKFHLSLVAPGTTGADGVATGTFLATAMDSARASRFGGDQTYSLYGAMTVKSPGAYELTNQARAAVNTGTSYSSGPRWWAGAANENTNDPNGTVCGNHPEMGGSPYSCVLTDLTRNAGAITGVGIFNIKSYNTIASSTPFRDIESLTSTVERAADFNFYWGATAGTVDSVVDVTHHVKVPFSPVIRASWGILNDSSFTDVVNKQLLPDTSVTVMTWGDAACIPPSPAYFLPGTSICGGPGNFTTNGGAFLMNHAVLNPVVFKSSSYANNKAIRAAGATGTGFILYLNGEFFLMQMAALPASTVWHMRSFAGNVTGTNGTFGFAGATRPATVPGLKVRLSYTGSTFDPTVTNDSVLARVHTVPDPYYVTNALEITANTKVLRFVNMPARAIIRIYSVSGILVNMITHNDVQGGGETVWNLRNRNNQFVASGVYFYHVETPDGHKKIGRFTVVNYAQ